MKMNFYQIKSSINCSLGSIPVLRPDNVSLAKCVTCHQFIRKYASFSDIEVMSMLKDGCTFKGFKKIIIESLEEEGFVNMHHVLILSLKDENYIKKEVCTQKVNNLLVKTEDLKKGCVVVTDIGSVVVIMQDNLETLKVFFFSKQSMKMMCQHFELEEFYAYLVSDILYLYNSNVVVILNFRSMKTFTNTSNKKSLMSCELFVTKCEEQLSHYFNCYYLHANLNSICVFEDSIDDICHLPTVVVKVGNQLLLVSAGNKLINIRKISNKRKFLIIKSFSLESIDHDNCEFKIESICYCSCTSQVFALYFKQTVEGTTSLIVVVDLLLMKISSLLEMELTLNRKPSFTIYPSKDGRKMFVQETFENKVIFYQVFTLLPSGLSLQNIVKLYIRNTFSEDTVKNMSLPRSLQEDLLDGY